MEHGLNDGFGDLNAFQSSSVGDDGWNVVGRGMKLQADKFQSSSVGDDGWNLPETGAVLLQVVVSILIRRR